MTFIHCSLCAEIISTFCDLICTRLANLHSVCPSLHSIKHSMYWSNQLQIIKSCFLLCASKQFFVQSFILSYIFTALIYLLKLKIKFKTFSTIVHRNEWWLQNSIAELSDSHFLENYRMRLRISKKWNNKTTNGAHLF